MGSLMAWVGESVIGSFSRPHHHRRRIPIWAQVCPSRPYIREENVLETCGSLLDQNCVEGSRRPRRSPHMCKRCWRSRHMCGRIWNVGE